MRFLSHLRWEYTRTSFMKVSAVSILIASLLVAMTFFALYIIYYVLFLRRKRRAGIGTPVSDEKVAENGKKGAKTGKGDYGYCTLNEIVGYEIVQVKNIYSEKSDEQTNIETETRQARNFDEAQGVGVRPVVLGTTGSDGYQVTDEPVPSPEELERRRKKEQELKRIEEERKRLDEEEKRTQQEMSEVFGENQDSGPDEFEPIPDAVLDSILNFMEKNWEWSESPNDEYRNQLGMLEPSQEDIENAEKEQSFSLEEIKSAFEENGLSAEEQLIMEQILNDAERESREA